MQTALMKIVADKAIWVEARKQQRLLTSLQNKIQPNTRHFYDTLQGARTAFILECKKASPSRGMVRDGFNPARVTTIYKHYASAISVLTDEKYFQGSFNSLSIINQIAPQPILYKDFIADPCQIYLAHYYQADAYLLVPSVLDDNQYRQPAAVAHSLGMGVLAEVSDEEEQERTIILGAKVVGISDRDLCDLSIDLNRTRELVPKLRHNVTVVSESGINTYTQVRESGHFANSFLIGSALMAHDDSHTTVYRVLLGEDKVYGLTRGQDAKAAYDAGTIYGGLIFVATSPRYVNVEQAWEVMAAAPLRYVDVFRNHGIAGVVDKAKVLSLATVQLHGNEGRLYIDTLREALPAHVTIWKTSSVGKTLPAREFQHVDKYILDNGQGGSGQRFDWSLLNGQSLGNVLLAEGLGVNNCVEAAQAGCAGLDFNSVIESQPGIKDTRLLTSVFRALHAY